MTNRVVLYGGTAVGLGLLLAWSLWPSANHDEDADALPEGSTGRRDVQVVKTSDYIVVSAHPLASRAGQEVIETGGSAVDAAIAVQAMLTLVEPQSSGIGGGAFMVHFDAKAQQLETWDGRETAPAGANANLFLTGDGEPYEFIDAVVGGRSVGVPGVLRMLEKVHEKHGTLPWDKLFEAAIKAAENGFEVTPRLHGLLNQFKLLRLMPGARSLYFPHFGGPLRVGEVLKNPDLARSLRLIAEQGAEAFYTGALAEKIVRAVGQASQPPTWIRSTHDKLLSWGIEGGVGTWLNEPNPGLLSLEDLASYTPKERQPICINYRKYRVCGHPPPTSGGLAALQMLGMLEHFDLSSMAPDSVEAAHLLIEAGRLAFADRNVYIGDPDFVDIDLKGLLDEKYLAKRASLISMKSAREKVFSGKPSGKKHSYLPDNTPSLPSTSHLNIVDKSGNTISMTTSIENAFGSNVVVEGFLLNNQLTDFAFNPIRRSQMVANSVEPGKRPRSSMTPLIVFDQESGEPVIGIGSAGGSRIIGFVVQALVGMVDWGLNPQEALNLPHVVGRKSPIEIENEAWAPGALDKVKQGLEALGHEVMVTPLNSGLHAFKRANDGSFEGGVDPRREGEAVGGDGTQTSAQD